MKKFLLIISFSCWMPMASAQLSCTDLAELTVGLEDISEDLIYVEDYGHGTELDESLRVLINALVDVAKIEQDPKLSRWVEDAKRAWKEMDREIFDVALERITLRLDEMGMRDCND